MRIIEWSDWLAVIERIFTVLTALGALLAAWKSAVAARESAEAAKRSAAAAEVSAAWQEHEWRMRTLDLTNRLLFLMDRTINTRVEQLTAHDIAWEQAYDLMTQWSGEVASIENELWRLLQQNRGWREDLRPLAQNFRKCLYRFREALQKA